MTRLRDLTDKYHLNIRKYQEIKNIKILDTDDGKFVLKTRNPKEDGLYEYLNNKNFDYLLEKQEMDEYDLFPYIHEIEIPNEEKAIDLVYILSLLHNKTTFYQKIVLDQVKAQYEDLVDQINYLDYYYHDLQDVIEQKVYMSPEEYLLIRNISSIYFLINYAREQLNSWYSYKIKQKKERVVLIHSRPSLDHLLIGKRKQLISWDQYRRDIPIYDFIYFYKHNYMDVEMTTLFDLYQSKFYYTIDEYLLFLVHIALPDKIEFKSNHYLNCKKVYYLIKYVEKTREFVSKENEKNKKEDEDKLTE